MHVSGPQPLYSGLRRSRILEHDARGFLVIMKSVVGPQIVGAAGSPECDYGHDTVGHSNLTEPPFYVQ
jgi:hypothetical protein